MSEINNELELIKQIDTFSECIEEAINIASKKLKKLGISMNEGKLAMKLSIDAGHWSRMKSGKAHFPPDKIKDACEALKDDFILRWLAYRQGYEIRVIPKTLEETIESQKKIIEERDRKIAIFEEMFLKLGNGEK